jgi:pyridoxal phosphate enzyme (YggS family)
MNPVFVNLRTVQERIAKACIQQGRAPESVRLIAVSKNFGVDAVSEAIRAGQTAFAENYVDEGVEKILALAGSGLVWHFIGPVQSNKTRAIAEHFDWVQSVDRLKIAQRLSDQRPEHLPALDVCVQVNISNEASKSGCAPADAPALCAAIAQLPRLRLRGLMAIPAPGSDHTPFRALRELHERIRSGIDRATEFDTLSIGMSDDFTAAIAEGSTMVRIGTSIFGSRKSQ